MQVLSVLAKLATFLKQPGVLNQAPSVSPDSLGKWVHKARHLSEFVKQSTAGGGLGEDTIAALLKYDHPTQDKLAKVVIEHQLTKRQATKLFKAYDENPQIDLDEYVKWQNIVPARWEVVIKNRRS